MKNLSKYGRPPVDGMALRRHRSTLLRTTGVNVCDMLLYKLVMFNDYKNASQGVSPRLVQYGQSSFKYRHHSTSCVLMPEICLHQYSPFYRQLVPESPVCSTIQVNTIVFLLFPGLGAER